MHIPTASTYSKLQPRSHFRREKTKDLHVRHPVRAGAPPNVVLPRGLPRIALKERHLIVRDEKVHLGVVGWVDHAEAADWHHTTEGTGGQRYGPDDCRVQVDQNEAAALQRRADRARA